MKRKLTNLLFGLIFLIGLGIFAYPAVSDQWNAYRQSKLISTYEEVVSELEPEDYSREWAAAHAFNDAFAQNDFTGDAFGSGESPDGDAGLEVRNRARKRHQASHRRPGHPLRAGSPQRPAQCEAVHGFGPDGAGRPVLYPYIR